jgi:hypothetical protein
MQLFATTTAEQALALGKAAAITTTAGRRRAASPRRRRAREGDVRPRSHC